MTTYLRSASLTHFADVAARHGLDPLALVREVGLPPRCLDDPDLTVPSAAVARLLELAAQRGREPAFGLLMAESRRLSNLGPLGLLIRDEPTLRSALEAMVRHIHVHNEALVVRVEAVAHVVAVRAELLSDPWPVPPKALTKQPAPALRTALGAVPDTGSPDLPLSLRQATELAVGVMFRVFSLFLGAGWRPRLVCFTHRAPADPAVHRRLFGRAIEFGHEFNGIVCHAEDLDAPNPGADPVMSRYTRRLLEDEAAAQRSMTARVRQVIALLLPRGHCQVERVAQHLGIDRRTVARRLQAEGTSFSALVDSLRAELLQRYLAGQAHPLSQIAALLGFSTPSSFSRWHRQQFGQTASGRRVAGAVRARGPVR